MLLYKLLYMINQQTAKGFLYFWTEISSGLLILLTKPYRYPCSFFYSRKLTILFKSSGRNCLISSVNCLQPCFNRINCKTSTSSHLSFVFLSSLLIFSSNSSFIASLDSSLLSLICSIEVNDSRRVLLALIARLDNRYSK